MLPVAATHFDQQLSPLLGIEAGTVDWTGVRTSSHLLAPPASRPDGYPVVLYSPGQGVPRTLGTALVEDLASRGYVVVSIDHTHDASEVAFPGGRLELDRIPELTPDVVEKLVHVRVADTRFVLDQLAILRQGGNPDAERRQLPRGLGRALDLSRVGMFGHSAGGFAAAQTMYEDQRIDAGVNLDGTLDYELAGKDLSPVARHGLDRPFLLMGAGAVTHHTMPSWTSFWEHSTGWKLDLNVARGAHFTFTDYQTFLPQLDHALGLPPELLQQAIGTLDSEADRQRIVRSERAYLAAFFDQHLRGQPRPLLWWPTPEHPDISFVR
jgi:dienelactone hydrolase